jgi:hypothetical protein
MISVASEKNISTAKKRDIDPFKVNVSPILFCSNCLVELEVRSLPWGQAQLRIFDRKFLPALKITKLVFSSDKL